MRAKGHDETELLPLAATVPFDDRVNQTAKISDLRLGLIREKVIKHPDRPEATRRFNYPMAAIAECLCNAIYHRSYETREPVEVRILPDRLTIGSFPGPDPSISDKDLKRMRFISRRYRNRRIGEFLKELDMTEGRGTGIPRVLKAVQANESPAPVFHTDPDRTFFVAEFPLHPAFAGDLPSEATPQIARKVEAQEALVDQSPTQSSTQSSTQSTTQSADPVSRLLLALESSPKSAGELREWLGLKHRSTFRGNYLHPALERGLIENTIPGKPNSRLQKYRLTTTGRGLLEKLVSAGRIGKLGIK